MKNRKSPAPKHIFSLWDLLTILSGGGAVGGSLQAIKLEKMHGGLALIALMLGIILGITAIRLIRKVGSLIVAKIIPISKTNILKAKIMLITVYTLAFLWFVFSVIVSPKIVTIIINNALNFL